VSDPAKWQTVNAAPDAMSLDMSRCCAPATRSGSAIDQFYDTVSHVLTLGDPQQLTASATLGRLLLLGVMTATESYFRDILFGVVVTCPIARESISDQTVPFGASEYYGPERIALGLFEGVSFASKSEVEKKSQQIAGVKWTPQSSLGAALANYEQVCHVRHAATHAHGVLNRGNARALGVLERRGQSLQVVIDLAHLHSAARACTSLVRAYNNEVYNGILKRWLDRNLLKGSWIDDKSLFGSLFELFRSKQDAVSSSTAYNAYVSFRPRILARIAGGR
jgi:hypothetical protein